MFGCMIVLLRDKYFKAFTSHSLSYLYVMWCMNILAIEGCLLISLIQDLDEGFILFVLSVGKPRLGIRVYPF